MLTAFVLVSLGLLTALVAVVVFVVRVIPEGPRQQIVRSIDACEPIAGLGGFALVIVLGVAGFGLVALLVAGFALGLVRSILETGGSSS